MRFFRSRILLSLAAIAFLLPVLLAFRYHQQERDITALREAFGAPLAAYCMESCPWIPDALDKEIYDLTREITKDDYLADCRLRQIRRICGGRLDSLEMGLQFLTVHPGEALRRMPYLKRIFVDANPPTTATEADMVRFITALRGMPQLDFVELSGKQTLTDGSIAPLTGHPKLYTLVLIEGRVTRASIPTFTSLPALGILLLSSSSATLPDEEFKAIKAALEPKVKVERL